MHPEHPSSRLRPKSNCLSWVHFGDLHITDERQQNYRDFLDLINAANHHLTGAGGVDFAFLPGDNADNGTEKQFHLVKKALARLRLPVHILPGDHDIQGGDLRLFHQVLEPTLPKSLSLKGYRLVFLNSVDIVGAKGFDFGHDQIRFLEEEFTMADRAGESTVLFMHTYPSELASGSILRKLLQQHPSPKLVEMGHTHYNELANDGRVIYAATRSTGQIEEGPVGFSITCLDNDVVSWKFKALETPWPLVMITSPADQVLRTEGQPTLEGLVEIRARTWGEAEVIHATCRVDDLRPLPMIFDQQLCQWRASIDFSPLSESAHEITVSATDAAGHKSEDRITVHTGASGEPPSRRTLDMDNAVGASPAKGILGTQLGPNKNGRKW